MKKILVLNGPNLNLLGTREPDIYGSMTLETLNNTLRQAAANAGFRLETFQSNAESALIEAIHKAALDHVDYLIFNPAAYTHTSIALRDALLAVGIPFIEVHLSNTAAREPYRRNSFFSDIAAGVISGFGSLGYTLALTAIVSQFTKRES